MLTLLNSGSTHIYFKMDEFEELYENIDDDHNGTVCYLEILCFVKQFMVKKIKEHVHDHEKHN